MMTDRARSMRYARQTAIAEIGVEGQRKLLESTVLLLVGDTGLPPLIKASLKAAGVGRVIRLTGDPCSGRSDAWGDLGSNPDCRVEYAAALPPRDPDVALIVGKAAECRLRLEGLAELGVKSPVVVCTGGPGVGETLICGAGLSKEEYDCALRRCVAEDSPPDADVLFAAVGEVVKVIVGNAGLPLCRAVIFNGLLGGTRDCEAD